MKRWLLWLPLVVFLVLAGFAVRELRRPSDRTVYSAMVGKPVPSFDLPPIVTGKPGLSAGDLRTGQPQMTLTGWAAERMAAMTPPGHRAVVHVTLTDDHPWAQAFVVIEAVPLA